MKNDRLREIIERRLDSALKYLGHIGSTLDEEDSSFCGLKVIEKNLEKHQKECKEK